MILVRALLVAAGGTLGVAARLGLELVIAALVEERDAGGIPLAILMANIVGSFLLGVLVARVPEASDLRLLLGTGVLGGFTTYSALALGIVELWAQHPALSIGYALGSVALGLGAAVAGLRLGFPRKAPAR